MVQQNLFSSQNAYVKNELGGMQVIEYARDMSVSPYTSKMEYYMAAMNVNKRQVLLNLNGNSYTIQAGAMQWTAGQVQMQTGVTGVGNFLGKMVSAAVTKESAVKPIYAGYGQMMLEPTYRHILLTDVSEWGGSIVLDDGLFLACDSNLQQKVVARSNVSSAVFGGEGLFNLSLIGQGVLALESIVPKEEIIEINLQNDMMKIDGNMAIAWSGSLEFTTETATKGLINSAISKEGLVNVYRGTGRIWMAPVFTGKSAGAATAGETITGSTETAATAQTGTSAAANDTINKLEKVGKFLDMFNN